MKPFHNLAETRTPNGARFSLHEHDGQFFLKLDGRQLMGSNSTVSELMLADLACAFREPRDKARILIGGLGLGFSLKRVLEICGPAARVEVAELLPENCWHVRLEPGADEESRTVTVDRPAG